MKAIAFAEHRIGLLAAASMLVCVLSVLPRSGSAQVSDIQRLVARAQIQDLIVRYTHAFDALDAEGYVSTFTENAVFELAGGDVREGHDAIRRIITERRQTPADPSSLEHHVVTNSLIEFISDEKARHSGYWLTIVGDLATGFDVPAIGKYEDIVVMRDGEWLFESRKLILPELPQ